MIESTPKKCNHTITCMYYDSCTLCSNDSTCGGNDTHHHSSCDGRNDVACLVPGAESPYSISRL